MLAASNIRRYIRNRASHPALPAEGRMRLIRRCEMSAVMVTTRLGTSVRPQPIEAPAATRLRLTRRGRAVFTALASLPLVIWAMIGVLGSGGAAAESGAARAATSFEYVT